MRRLLSAALSRRFDSVHALSVIYLIILFLSLATWSWMKWPDELVDFGQQLYVPWQLIRDRTLYQDIPYWFGPFSPYFNAALFRSFGMSIRTLVWANLGFLAGISFFIFLLLRVIAGLRVAVIGTTTFLTLFGFSQYVHTGNFNFVLPVAHEVLHGTFLSYLLLLICLRKKSQTTQSALLKGCVSGVTFGLILLTKAEFIFATALFILAYAFLYPSTQKLRRKELLGCLIGTVIPILFTYLFFLLRLDFKSAFQATWGALVTLLATPISSNIFWLWGMGTDRTWENLWQATQMASGLSIGIILLYCGDRLFKDYFNQYILFGISLFSFAGFYKLHFLIPWRDLPRCLPIFCVLALARLFYKYRRERNEQTLKLLLFGVFAMGLLGKMILNCRFFHYGFYLAPPATLFLIAVAFRRKSSLGPFAQAVGSGFIASFIVVHLLMSHAIYLDKNLEIGTGNDQFLAFNNTLESRAVTHILKILETNSSSDSTLMVLPEGTLINYLARRPSPNRYSTFLGGEMAVYGEDVILNAMKASSPDLIVLIHKNTVEFGLDYFGTSMAYGKKTMDWIRAHYRVIDTFIRAPFTKAGFGSQILIRAELGQRTSARRELKVLSGQLL